MPTYWGRVFRRAWRDTVAFDDPRKRIYAVVIGLSAVALGALVGARETRDLSDAALYGFAGFGVIALLLFLVQLTRAPVRLDEERVDDIQRVEGENQRLLAGMAQQRRAVGGPVRERGSFQRRYDALLRIVRAHLNADGHNVLWLSHVLPDGKDKWSDYHDVLDAWQDKGFIRIVPDRPEDLPDRKFKTLRDFPR